MNSAAPSTITKVIDGDFCIGCGACAALDNGFKLANTKNGFIKVVERPSEPERLARASAVCPFAAAPDEDQIAATLFGDATKYEEGIGRYRSLYAGWSEEFRSVAGSGGITRWLLSRALRTGYVDYALVVDRKLAGESQPDLFSFAIHDTAEALLTHTSSSAYYPVSLAELLRVVRARPGRFAVTALPCFARALRSVAIADPLFGERMALITGTICGALKSRRYAEYLSYQMGVAPDRIGRLNFRGKSLSRQANEKCVEVWAVDNDGVEPDAVRRVQDLLGTDYGVGYFKPKACDYCDDVFAETADISFGDAWILPYSKLPHGTNVIVVRDAAVDAMLVGGLQDGELFLEPLSPEQVLKTQESGLRHRRNGLATRLSFAKATGRWVPPKRVGALFGGPALAATQIIRVLVRKITSAPSLIPNGKLMPALASPLIFLHGKLRRFSVRPRPAPPRVRATAEALLQAKPDR